MPYSANHITTLRHDMQAHLHNGNVPPPMGLEQKDEFLLFLAGFMAPWCLRNVNDDVFIANDPLRHQNHVGLLCDLGLEGHTGRPSNVLRRDVLLPAIRNGNVDTVLRCCHQAYWKATPYPDFFRPVGGLLDILLGVDEPNMLGYLLREKHLSLAAGTAFMLPGLVANRTDYWAGRFIAAGADPEEIPIFLEGLQNYWQDNLPR